MVRLMPFNGWRPLRQYVERMISPPYDIVSQVTAQRTILKNPYSFLQVELPKINPKEDTDCQTIYEKAAQNLLKLKQKGCFMKVQNVLYLYSLTSKNHIQRGIVGRYSLEDYQEGRIKKHEKTHSEKVRDRIEHIKACHAQTGLAFLAYPKDVSLKEWMSQYGLVHVPVYDFLDEEDVRHTVYEVKEADDLESLIKLFKKVPSLYIADGHHRIEAAYQVALEEKNPKAGFLAAAFMSDELCILPYHRHLKTKCPLSEQELKARLKLYFQVQPLKQDFYEPQSPRTWGMCFKGQWYKLCLKEALAGSNTQNLDVEILQRFILDPIFKLKPEASLDFIGGTEVKTIMEKQEKVYENIIFTLYPVTFEQIMLRADKKGLMPPKSTWFEPKLPSGLFINDLT